MLLFVIILLSMKSFDCPVIYASRSYYYFIISKTYGQHSLCLHLRSLDDPGFYGKIVYIHDKDGQTMRKGPDSYAEECYCKKIRHIAAQVTRIYDQYLKEAGLTSQQFSTLEYIRGLGPVSVTELSREMGLDRTSLSRNLKVMEHNSLIEDHREGGRNRQIVLSEHGEAVLLKAEAQWKKAQTDLESMFSPEQLGHFRGLIDVFKERLG